MYASNNSQIVIKIFNCAKNSQDGNYERKIMQRNVFQNGHDFHLEASRRNTVAVSSEKCLKLTDGNWWLNCRGR